MSKVTRKLQVSLPKALAVQYDIHPGDDIQWEAAGEIIRVIPPDRKTPVRTRGERLRLFDEATARQQRRQAGPKVQAAANRGWSRAELYDNRGSAD